MQAEKNEMGNWRVQFPFKYQVVQQDGGYFASTPYRQVYYHGDTAEEAIGFMLRGMAELGRNGAIDPDEPERPGAPPVQHALTVLVRRLTWQLERRREKLEHAGATPGDDAALMELVNKHAEFTRDNEIIAGLATAVAALARVKEL